jgi:hypothetical protein
MLFAGAIIAVISFACGYRFNSWLDDVSFTPDTTLLDSKPYNEAVDTTNVIDTADIYRIKSGPKKGLLSYKRARGE